VALKYLKLEGKDINFDALDRIDYKGADGYEDDNNRNDNFGVGNSIGKALALVKQIIDFHLATFTFY
jgi:hypothetical protein